MAADNPDDPNFSFEDNPDLWLFTSLTAGSSHIITATSRMETILKANRVPFKAIDTATNEKARKIWGRRSQGKRLPGLVKEGWVLCDLTLLEEWNEYGETKENLGVAAPITAVVPPSQRPPPEAANMKENQAPSSTSVKGTPDASARTSTDTVPRDSMSARLATEAAAAAVAKKKEAAKPATAEPKSKDEVEKDSEDVTVAEPESAIDDSEAKVSPLNIPDKNENDPPRKDSYVKGEPGVHASFDTRPPNSSPQRSRASSRANRSAASSPPTGTGSASLAFPVLKRSEKVPEKTAPASASSELTKAINEASREGEEQRESHAVFDESAQPAAKSGLDAVTSDPEAMKVEQAEAEKAKLEQGPDEVEEGRAPPPKPEIIVDQIDPPLTLQTKTTDPRKDASPLADAPETTSDDSKTESATKDADASLNESATVPSASEEEKQEVAAEGDAKEPEEAGKSVGD